jgi:NADH-quinone oxidoreductase subunit L
MANRQNIDLMSGFRRAMPFTSALLIIGALSLAAFPGTAGFFSKDEILVFATERGGAYWIFTVGGYFGALLTAIYSFRIGFRVVWGEPSPEARELEQGHVHHAEPENPATGEPEDTDIGFPGPSHQIAEREWPMKVAMSILGFGALFAGYLQIPGVDNVVENFLNGTFQGSKFADTIPSNGSAYAGLLVGGILSIAGIAIAYLLYVRRPGTTAELVRRFGWLHDFLEHKWYFDEAIDILAVRPTLAVGRWANSTFERYVVQGLIVGVTDVVRGASAGVRGAQSGYLRSYALLLVTGFAGLGLYFLLQAS